MVSDQICHKIKWHLLKWLVMVTNYIEQVQIEKKVKK